MFDGRLLLAPHWPITVRELKVLQKSELVIGTVGRADLAWFGQYRDCFGGATMVTFSHDPDLDNTFADVHLTTALSPRDLGRLAKFLLKLRRDRRPQTAASSERKQTLSKQVEYGPWIIFPPTGQAYNKATKVPLQLSQRSTSILLHFLQNPAIPVTRASLITSFCPLNTPLSSSFSNNSRSLDQYLLPVRRILGESNFVRVGVGQYAFYPNGDPRALSR
jgi:hypothetical protein